MDKVGKFFKVAAVIVGVMFFLMVVAEIRRAFGEGNVDDCYLLNEAECCEHYPNHRRCTGKKPPEEYDGDPAWERGYRDGHRDGFRDGKFRGDQDYFDDGHAVGYKEGFIAGDQNCVLRENPLLPVNFAHFIYDPAAGSNTDVLLFNAGATTVQANIQIYDSAGNPADPHSITLDSKDNIMLSIDDILGDSYADSMHGSLHIVDNNGPLQGRLLWYSATHGPAVVNPGSATNEIVVNVDFNDLDDITDYGPGIAFYNLNDDMQDITCKLLDASSMEVSTVLIKDLLPRGRRSMFLEAATNVMLTDVQELRCTSDMPFVAAASDYRDGHLVASPVWQ